MGAPTGDTREIPLSQGMVAIVDAEWHDALVACGRWYGARRGVRTVYAWRRVRGVQIYMHRLIAGAQKGQEVDHINGDGLDNRSANLRLVTRAQNNQNQAPRLTGSSRFKGVYWSEYQGCWRVQIKDRHFVRAIGGIADEETAGRIYDLLAKDRFGAHARLNFPPEATE